MDVTVKESNSGRKTTSKSASRQYFVNGATTEGSALTTLLGAVGSTIPPQLNGMDISLPDCGVEEAHQNFYIGTVVYQSPDAGGGSFQQAGSFSISLEIGTQSQHIMRSISTRFKTVAAGFTTLDFKNALNVDMDKNINGLDIVAPVMNFTLNYTVAPNLITDAYIATLAGIVGTINKDIFKTYQPGELLLTRVSGSKRDSSNWDLGLGFGVSKNKVNLSVPTGGHVDKKGWDYLWIYYEIGDSAGIRLPVPKQAQVEQVYDESTYADMNLPS